MHLCIIDYISTNLKLLQKCNPKASCAGNPQTLTYAAYYKHIPYWVT